MKYIYIYILILFSFLYKAQNLVPNGSFEAISTSTSGVTCPTGVSPNYFFVCLSNWFSSNLGSPDLFAYDCDIQCGIPKNKIGTQNTKDGYFYAGFCTYIKNFSSFQNYKEYVSVKLTDTLKAGRLYCFSMHISLSDSSKYLANPLSVYFSNNDPTDVNNSEILSYTPQLDFNFPNDTSHWIHLQSSFVATGGESYITIGSFKDSANMQVSIVNPFSSYKLCYYYIDDVSLMETSNCTTGINEIDNNNGRISVYPNPNNGTFSIAFTFLQAKHSFELYDMMGRKVNEKTLNGNEGVETINGEALGNGVYFYKILDSNGKLLFTGKLAINK